MLCDTTNNKYTGCVILTQENHINDLEPGVWEVAVLHYAQYCRYSNTLSYLPGEWRPSQLVRPRPLCSPVSPCCPLKGRWNRETRRLFRFETETQRCFLSSWTWEEQWRELGLDPRSSIRPCWSNEAQAGDVESKLREEMLHFSQVNRHWSVKRRLMSWICSFTKLYCQFQLSVKCPDSSSTAPKWLQ